MRFVAQHDQMDCGPACLAMVCSYHGRRYPLSFLRQNSYLTREGVSLWGIKEAAKKVGLGSFSTAISVAQLVEEKEVLPAIIHWNQNHFVVLRKITRTTFRKHLRFHIADPSYGFITLALEKFERHWCSEPQKGIVLYLHPADDFYARTPPKTTISIKYLLSYLLPYRKSLLWVFVFLGFGALISLVLPFLTQALIDRGIQAGDLNYVSLILTAQLALFLGMAVFDMMRNWLMLVVGTKINIKIISDFLYKLLRLPIHFFETKLMGDFNQRISDHDRIEYFLTSQSIFTFFSIITFSVFSAVLGYYNLNVFFLYAGLSFISIFWAVFWMARRKRLNYFKFQSRSENQEIIYETINGVTEIKLNQFEDYKRLQWESIQQKLFKTNIRILKIDQIQSGGFHFINQLKNIIVTFLVARLVIQGHLTLGVLLSISYIVGQMNGPITQFINFLQSLQDAKLSLARLNEVQTHKDEESLTPSGAVLPPSSLCQHPIRIAGLSFQYEGPQSPFVLKELQFQIPPGKVTAIVGASGSGKTTLVKLLLRFYEPTQGHIFLGEQPLNGLSPYFLRKHSGAVMQDGYIFGDTIERNIVCGDRNVDKKRLEEAINIAHIADFIDSLPNGYYTKIGANGSGISGGQRQRILIARAVYKNPPLFFLDEATSALDAANEKIIHERLRQFFKHKTVVIVAHRLSTVKAADQIVVLNKGAIQEIGTHQELVDRQGEYYHLVKDQLALGN